MGSRDSEGRGLIFLFPLSPPPIPSLSPQQYFWTVLSLSKAAADVLAGRDRLATQLLTQFAVALLNLVCHNEMWEDSRYFVGPLGLHQVPPPPPSPSPLYKGLAA